MILTALRLLLGWKGDERGAAALDFAIVSLPLFLFLFGVAEFSRAIWIEEALQNTASTVARCIGVSASNCTLSGSYDQGTTKAYAENVAAGWGVALTDQNVTVSNAAASCPGSTGVTGTFATVTLHYPFSTVAQSLVPALASQTLTAQACFLMN
ncbi:MAG TPA: TadE/TadG family type IV pilus assembly protein [Rhodoblastus sp.]|nr:TadE/TadG family type IV pilus assembly protein [Rhodoblastus sp.]